MMKRETEKAKLTVTIDKQMKKEFAQLCEDIGLPVSAVVSALMSQAVRKQEVRLSSLDLNGFTPKEAAELRRRWEELKAMRDKMYAEAVK
ncbi:MAG: type II toxin-antitoxin system RelB/DinJ family antitoxin [Synergistaceae bacterium]|nr:type II toxin-antitoxin system RelB/DinJ family antitoxin [Synergistaceae bacterium]